MRRERSCLLRLVVAVALPSLMFFFGRSQQNSYGNSFEPIQTRNPLATAERNLALGLDHYDAHCASCHGASGKADTDESKRFAATDLTSERVQTASDTELFGIVSKGVRGTAMPAFGKTHTATEIWQIILFLRKLPNLTPDDRAKLEGAVPAGARHEHASHEHGAKPEHPEGSVEHQHEHRAPPAPQPPKNEPAAAEHQHQHEVPEAQAQKPMEIARPDKPQHSEMEHQHKTAPASVRQETLGHDTPQMGAMHASHEGAAIMTTITGGPFKSMMALGSGTSLLPASSPGYMWHWMKGDWMIMLHGDLKAGFNHQAGPRGINKAESQNWLMLMGEHQAGPGRLMLRGMFSAEPWTTPRRGFPELFQTGETFNRRPIIDAQHAHDLFMELAATYTLPLSEHASVSLYGGPVGEPALGPVAFMHRLSAAENPAAPLGHHWQDSTHITHGVVSAGLTAGRFKLEGSLFHGAEPDENRKDIELGKLDSWSGRIWFTPTPNWAMQFSYGHLVNPEALVHGNLERLTASISYNRPWTSGNWATSLNWGRNHEHIENSNSYLLESTMNFFDKNYLYTRLELVDKPGLLEENIWGRPGLDQFGRVGDRIVPGPLFERFFRVGAFTFGGVRDLVTTSKARLGVGADATFYHVSSQLTPVYGSNPTSFHLFFRLRPGKMSH